MKERKTPVIVFGIWQFIRFVILVSSSILFLNPRLFAGVSLLVISMAAPSLLLAVICFFCGWDSRKFAALRGFLVFGKALEIVPGLMLLLLQGGAMYFGIAKPVFDEILLVNELAERTVFTERLFYYGFAGIVLVDLIFLLVLLSYEMRSDDTEIEKMSAPGLPEYRIETLEEE